MPIPLLIIGAGIMAAAGIAKAIHGANQAKKGRRLAAQNKRPDYELQQEYFDNQTLAQNMAQGGMSQRALENVTAQAQRGLTTSTDAALQLGGGINSVSGAFDQYTQAMNNIAATDAEMQNQNIMRLMDVNNQLAGQKTQKWAIDKYEPYKDKAQQAAAMQKIGTENVFNGISQVGSAVASMGSAQNNMGGMSNMAYTPTQASRPASVSTGTMFNPSANMNSNIAAPTTAQSLNTMSRNAAVDDIMNQYQGSPYQQLVYSRLRGTA